MKPENFISKEEETVFKKSLTLLAAMEPVVPGMALGMEDEESLDNLQDKYRIKGEIPGLGVSKYTTAQAVVYMKWSFWDTVSHDSSPLYWDKTPYEKSIMEGIGKAFFPSDHPMDNWIRDFPVRVSDPAFVRMTGQMRDLQGYNRLNGRS